MKLAALAVMVAAFFVPVQVADAKCGTQECKARVAKKQKIKRIYPFCNTYKCVRRTTRKREGREMRRYKRNPLPWCTWGPESGVGNGQWSMVRYRMPNHSGGDGGGKFQIMDATWRNFGGLRYARHAYYATPVQQERIARKIAADGLHHWVNC